MRLTLRTLLAYLDGILEPNDAQELGKKVEESDFATELVHRIRDVMRRLRLAAPSPTDQSPQFDPNTVAEYLDNTLDADGVTDFEKVCLESDVHLAEVASCHQILALVLGEPAEIDPASRERMYQIKEGQSGAALPVIPSGGSSAAAPPIAPPVLDVGKGDGERGERKSRPKPMVPEYLREPRKSWRWAPPLVAAALLVFFTLVVLKALGQFEPGTPLGNMMVQWGVVELPPELAAKSEETSGDKGMEKGSEGQQATAAEAASPAKSATQPDMESAKEPTVQPAKEPVGESDSKGAEKPIVEKPAKQPSEPPAATAGEKTKPAAMPTKEAEKNPAVAADAALTPKPEATMGSKSAPLAGSKPADESLPPVPLGRFMSSGQVLLQDDSKHGGWRGVAVNQMLFPERLLVLPTYRVKITLTAGVTLEILGGTQIELLGSGPQEPAGIRILYGRVVMMPLAQPGSRLRVEFGNRRGVITFVDPESVAALQVRRLHLSGTNPEAGPPHVVADLYVSASGVSWEELGGGKAAEPLQLTAPQWVTFDGATISPPAAAKELPAWIVAEPIKALDRRASVSLAQALPTDQLARVALQELYILRPQKEVKWLSLRFLGYIGQFRDMVAVLKDPARKLDWPEYVDELRLSVARDAKSAEAVRQAIENQYPQQAAVMYRMLWGYSNEDLQNGADAVLFKALDDESLAVRVLSFWNLTDLTGMKLYYRPELTAAKRQQPLQRWQQRLDAKEIRLRTPEEKAGAAAEEKTVPAAPESGL